MLLYTYVVLEAENIKVAKFGYVYVHAYIALAFHVG